MAELHWFPFYVEDWRGSRAVRAMVPQQRSAYLELMITAWGDGDVEPSLSTDDTQLAAASGIGAQWKKLGPLVRAQFVERDGRLYNEKLLAVWHEQQQKHAATVKKASAGGKAKAAADRARRSAAGGSEGDGSGDASGLPQAEPERKPEIAEQELRRSGTLVPSELGVPAPAPAGALGAETPRAAGADRVAREHALEARYAALLAEKVEAWAIENNELYKQFEREARANQRLNGKPLTPMQSDVLTASILERVRRHNKWASKEKWVLKQVLGDAVDGGAHE